MNGDQDALLRVHMGQVLAFTGHRPNKVQEFEHHIKRNMVASMMLMEPKRVISGMALGVDMWAAETAVFLGIPLWAYVPFRGQEKLWPTHEQRRYNGLLDKAAKSRIVCEGAYDPPKMQARNEAMVDDCNLLLAYWNGSLGGTRNCLKYAAKVHRNWYAVHPDPTQPDPPHFGGYRMGRQ